MAKRRMKTPRKNMKAKRTSAKRGKKKPTAWNIHLMKVFKEMKAKDSKVQLEDAMKVARKSYKKDSADSWNVNSSKYNKLEMDASWVSSNKKGKMKKKVDSHKKSASSHKKSASSHKKRKGSRTKRRRR